MKITREVRSDIVIKPLIQNICIWILGNCCTLLLGKNKTTSSILIYWLLSMTSDALNFLRYSTHKKYDQIIIKLTLINLNTTIANIYWLHSKWLSRVVSYTYKSSAHYFNNPKRSELLLLFPLINYCAVK